MNIIVQDNIPGKDYAKPHSFFIHPLSINEVLECFGKESVANIVVNCSDEVNWKPSLEFFLCSFNILKSAGNFKLLTKNIQTSDADLRKWLEMSGFLDFQIGGEELIATKPDFTQTNLIFLPTTDQTQNPYKAPQINPPISNPWQQIDPSTQSQSIDESQLLQGQKIESAYTSNNTPCMYQSKPCANCTCGRAELENQNNTSHNVEEIKQQLETGDIKSECGKCYLGDVFRCQNCPYKGLPGFECGQKVQLPTQNPKEEEMESVKITQTKEGFAKIDI